MTLRAIPGLDPGPSGGRRAAPRGRAATLIELVLYLTITMLVLVFTIQLVDAEQQRRNSVIVTGTLQQAIQGAQLYVATEYDNLREELFDPDDAGPTSGKQMLLVVTDIPDGFFPPTFDRDDNALTRYHDQRFALLLRGVLRSDTDSPMATITPNDIDHESPMTSSTSRRSCSPMATSRATPTTASRRTTPIASSPSPRCRRPGF